MGFQIREDFSVIEAIKPKTRKRNIDDITEVVVHHTDGTRINSSLKEWMLDTAKEPKRLKKYKEGIGLFHFAISFDGDIWQLDTIQHWYYHSTCGKHDAVTVGVEFGHKRGPFTDKQYDAFNFLLKELIMKRCNISKIVSHDYNNNYYSGGKKGCPGQDFNFSKVTERLIADERIINWNGMDVITIG